MRKIVILAFLFSFTINAQESKKTNAAEIFNQIQKLNFLGSVLYIAAHPDDENTKLISYLSNYKHAQTAYLSLTRGDGGQNLIGSELRELLGTIRTQELIEARKIDGGQQFFSRANDFGYSKTPDETLKIWDKNEILSDVVWNIRSFQPDVIINRFDHRSPGTTHGHNTASAMLAMECFKLTNDPKIYPEQLKYVTTWQPKRIFFNTSWWFYGSQEKFDKADKSKLISLETGVYYSSLGKSNQEIAALSRSKHKSQGFGTTPVRGLENEYLELVQGEMPSDKINIFEGIDTTWNRIKGGKAIGEILTKVEQSFDFKNPSASVNELIKAYNLIQKLEDLHWKNIKTQEIKKIIAACTGLFLEAIASTRNETPDSNLKLKLEVINRSDISMSWVSYDTFLAQPVSFLEIQLDNNKNKSQNIEVSLKNLDFTTPYWLKNSGTIGMYNVENQENVGIPDIIRDLKVIFNINIQNTIIPFEREVIYKYNDEVKGEVYEPFNLIPSVTTSILDKVKIFNNTKSKIIGVKVKAGTANVKGNLSLVLNENWKVNPKSIPFEIVNKNEEKIFNFEVTPPANDAQIEVKCVVDLNGKLYDKEQIIIDYEHISNQQVLKPAMAKFVKLDIKIGKEKIAYIMGAGDEVPQYLIQMGYEVTIIKPTEITIENLLKFDVIMTGIRAYNTIDSLSLKQKILFDMVKQGKTMIVQYNTNGKLVTNELAPFPLKISNDRVTEENAEVRFLDDKNPILNTPNKITTKDFENWVQEQGLYYPSEWDKAFTPIISANDKGENAKNGAVLIASYGKGHYIYTGLSFFRELPAGVPGAYRLLANMISVGKN